MSSGHLSSVVTTRKKLLTQKAKMCLNFWTTFGNLTIVQWLSRESADVVLCCLCFLAGPQCSGKVLSRFNPNWHEGGHFPPPYPFWIRFGQLNFYQKFMNFFGGENWTQNKKIEIWSIHIWYLVTDWCSILEVAFWNFKVLKYPRNCICHATLMLNIFF